MRWLRKDYVWQVFSLANVSSTYLFHIVGWSVNMFKAFFSNLCMKSSAAKPDVDAPMA